MNGSPTKNFIKKQGFEAKDPTSPFLFTIADEGLVVLVKKESQMGEFKGLKVIEEVEYQLLQFADNIILVGEGSWKNLWCIKTVMTGFELVFGLRVNFYKSK